MKKVLLTGAGGFIGRHCIPYLLARDYTIYATYQTRLPENLQNFPKVEWIQVDLLDALQVAQMMEKLCVTHLMHLAWYVTPGKFGSSPYNMDWLKASLTLLEHFAKNGGKRVVMAGTCFEYEHVQEILSENETPLKPATLYGSAKLALSIALEGYAKQMQLSAAWARIFYLYGLHEYPQRFVPMVIRSLLQKQTFPCTHGGQLRDFLHVEDVADCLSALLDSTLEGPVNVASGKGISLRAIIEQVEEQLKIKGLAQFGAMASPANDPSHIVGNAERVTAELKWHPRWNIAEGIEKAIDWWKSETPHS